VGRGRLQALIHIVVTMLVLPAFRTFAAVCVAGVLATTVLARALGAVVDRGAALVALACAHVAVLAFATPRSG